MKKVRAIVSLLLALTLALSLTACGGQTNSESEQPETAFTGSPTAGGEAKQRRKAKCENAYM